MPRYIVTVTERFVTEFDLVAKNKKEAEELAEARTVDADWNNSSLLVCEREAEATRILKPKRTPTRS